MSEMKPCPVPGCDRRCSTQYMMCRTDWWRVRKDTQAAVYAAWDNFHNDPAAYRELREEAIGQAVASRERAANR